mmetsp:Transcript_59061/g.93437  ORF Transcript_59061/g.93437 Transcript_59061/m.93437 type:complete len:102 (+) Transcript_59061:47-352(+)
MGGRSMFSWLRRRDVSGEVSGRFEIGSRVEVLVNEQWLPCKITGLPSHDICALGRYCVQCDDKILSKMMASEKQLRSIAFLSRHESLTSVDEEGEQVQCED